MIDNENFMYLAHIYTRKINMYTKIKAITIPYTIFSSIYSKFAKI